MPLFLRHLFLAIVLFCGTMVLFNLLIPPPYKAIHLSSGPPSFVDDADPESLLTVLRQQEKYLKSQARQQTVTIGSRSFTCGWLLESLQDLIHFLQQRPSPSELDRFIENNYLVFQAGGRKNSLLRKMLVTGYYEPLFKGCRQRTPSCRFPLYRRPLSLVQGTDGSGRQQIGRYDAAGNFTSYWSRREIEEQGLLKGSELVYLRDAFDAFLLHIQGSGRIEFEDKTVRSLRFAGSNGLAYKSIGKYLVDRGIMELEAVNIETIRAYIDQYPDKAAALMQQNPRFIFFDWGDQQGPKGSLGVVLTSGRSIAIDGQVLPYGAIAYLQTERPILDTEQKITSWQPMARFVLAQDTGAAIKGAGRADFFWGNGAYAETAANHMRQPGRLYFLVKKGFGNKIH